MSTDTNYSFLSFNDVEIGVKNEETILIGQKVCCLNVSRIPI